MKPWLGKEEHGGVPSQPRPDRQPPPHWRLDAIYFSERPHHPCASLDGNRIAFVLSSGVTADIHVVPVTGGQSRRLTTDRELAPFWEDSRPLWSPDASLIAYTSGDNTYVVPGEGGPPQQIKGATLGAWLDDHRLVVVVERDRSTRLAVVDITDPWPRPFGPTGGDVTGARITGEGRVLAVFWPKTDRNRSDIVLAAPDGDWSTLVGSEDRRASSPVCHGDEVAYVAERGEWKAVFLTDLDGSEHRLLATGEGDFADLDFSPDGSRLVATRALRGQTDLVTIGRDGAVATLAEGGSWQTPLWAGETIVAVEEAHDRAPRLVAVSEDGVTVLYDGRPLAISAAPHVGFQRVGFASADGMQVEGFLFRPETATNPVPAVVYPHGGPTSVYGDEWDGHAHYFIDKGYAWLALNYRGSTTYGLEFERANHMDWGVGDTNDCIAAGRFLQSLDWVDPERIAIFGASYGSYLALTSLVHPDNPFACGVAKYGDCNILTSWAQGDRPGVDDLERMMGHPSQNRAGYRAGSPIHVVERLDRPLLIAHGEKDARVHPQQAEELVAALRRLGKTYEYVTYPEEAHGFLRRDSQLDFYRRLERFLDWYLI